MTDLIDRKTAIESCMNHYEVGNKEQNSVIDWCVDMLTGLPSAQPEPQDVPDTNVGDMISRQAEIERIDRIFRDLNIACAYDMPSFWYNKGKDYAVIPTKYHKGYQRALEDAEARIMDALKDGEQDG